MKGATVFFAIVALGFVESFRDSGLKVRFDVGLHMGDNYFIDVPQFKSEAIEKQWLPMERPPSPLPSLVMYCAPELTFCALYDPDTEFVAGTQVGLPMNEFKDCPYSFEVQGFIPWTPPVKSGEPVTYMTKQVYLISEETLSKSVKERTEKALAKEVLQEDYIWVTSFHQQLMAIPTNVTGIVDAGFTEQACFPMMGQHYYYQMSHDTPCQEDTLLNWFPLTVDDKMIGIGFTSFGALEKKDDKKFYFERPPTLAVKAIVPKGPQCLYDLADNPTLTTMHLYFITDPWTLLCLPSWIG